MTSILHSLILCMYIWVATYHSVCWRSKDNLGVGSLLPQGEGFWGWNLVSRLAQAPLPTGPLGHLRRVLNVNFWDITYSFCSFFPSVYWAAWRLFMACSLLQIWSLHPWSPSLDLRSLCLSVVCFTGEWVFFSVACLMESTSDRLSSTQKAVVSGVWLLRCCSETLKF